MNQRRICVNGSSASSMRVVIRRRFFSRRSLLPCSLAAWLVGVWLVAWQHGNLPDGGDRRPERNAHRRMMLLGGVGFPYTIFSSSANTYQPVPAYARKRFFSPHRSGWGFRNSSNNIALNHLLGKGWARTQDVAQAELIWQLSCCANWKTLQPWQRVSHVRNETVISDKGALLNYLAPGKKGFHDFDALPETYRLWVDSDRARFFQSIGRKDEKNDDDAAAAAAPEKRSNGWDRVLPAVFGQKKSGEEDDDLGLWAVKIPYIDGGKGLSFLSTERELQDLREISKSEQRIVQRYINNPLLTEDGNKLDLRVYWFVASTNPPLIFVRPDVTMRISISKYRPGTLDLTNEQQNKYKERWDELKESSRGTSAHLEALVRAKYPHRFDDGDNDNDPLRDINCQIQRALAEVFARSYPSLGGVGDDSRTTDNGFSLMGADFMIDSDLRVWLLEIQSGPGLPTSSEVAQRTTLEIVPEMLDIALEIGEKQRAGSPVFPLESVRKFQLIVNGTRVAEKFGPEEGQYDGAQLLSEGAVLPACSSSDSDSHDSDVGR